MLEQPPRERLGRPVDGEPEEERRLAARVAQPLASSTRQERLPLAPVELAHGLDVRLVRPGGDRGALHELLRRRAGRRPEGAQRVGDLGAGAQTKPER